MFSRISGTLVERDGEHVVLETGGLGYDVVLPPCIAEKITAAPGERVALEIYAALNIDGNSARATYYGFTNAIERAFFEALISVASIGPRTAARAFSEPMSAIASAIDRGDYGYLRKLPGIGQQKARDIVAKLQGKVARFLLIRDAPPSPPAAMPDFADEALSVLLQLEYKRGEAEAMIRETLQGTPQIADAETLLAQIYRRKTPERSPA
ncbi:MAG TPA: Holliday junction branch migration protein RuvA [Candidatus Baltobacteraceae bacterium]|nr:Holliday junction branch migration protein RuvA [Candidatus Baltobacteraceae bacterium]